MFHPEDLEGKPISLADLPLSQGSGDRGPPHATFRITGLDGVKRTIAATSFPLFARVGELPGAVAMFWERGRMRAADLDGWVRRGCRGRSPGRRTVRYGGNTSCVEVRVDEDNVHRARRRVGDAGARRRA